MADDYETGDYKVRHYGDVTVVRLKYPSLSETLDIMRMTQEVGAMIDNGLRKLVLDLKHVKFCGSAGLGMMIALSRRMSGAGGQFVLSHPEHVRELLELSRTIKLFRLASDPREAVEMLQ